MNRVGDVSTTPAAASRQPQSQRRLRGLLRASQLIASQLDLASVLRAVVVQARDLVGARHAGLGLIGPENELTDVVVGGEHVGEDRDFLQRLLDRAHDTPAGSFLAVPITVRDAVFGTLYLSAWERRGFTTEDEELVLSLAATAGVAIENVQIYEMSAARMAWVQASAEVTKRLLTDRGDDLLHLAARQVKRIADADLVCIVLPVPPGTDLRVEVAVGVEADRLAGIILAVGSTVVGRAVRAGRAMLIDDFHLESDIYPGRDFTRQIGPSMVVALVGSQRVRGALFIARRAGRPRFTLDNLEMAETFAGQAAVALELADARVHEQRAALLEDRDRIARDLHDHVIQRLYATGLSLQGLANTQRETPQAARLLERVNDIDETIREIRNTIFKLRGPLGLPSTTVRARLFEVIGQVSALLGFEPRTSFVGAVEFGMPDGMVDDLLAVVREGLTNVAKHAGAGAVDVMVSASSTTVTVQITDDGSGYGTSQRRSGLANLRMRAEQWNGTLVLESGPSGGTRLIWSAPGNASEPQP